MTWGAVAGAAVGVVGSALTSKSGGGAGTQTATKEPWAAAQPWILNNLAQGQKLQDAYTAQPFSDAQNQAYANQNNQSAYMRALVPSLLGQMSGQQVGYDRSNPNARPAAFNFNGAGNGAGGGGAGGLLGMLAQAPMAAPASTATLPAPAPAAAPVSDAPGYGEFKYGMFPTEGTQAHKDMRAYFSQFGANGAGDPYGIYANRGATTAQYGT
jgi:hypothetical protein